jgi:glycosyltransferase involved in cell wall biosynthesis
MMGKTDFKLLTVIIPVYNGADKITNCLDSIYQQGLNEEMFEVICVDDSSADNTSQVITEYGQGCKNLILLRNEENKCIGGARNVAIKAAKGKYVIFVDHDDRLDNLQKLIFYIEKWTPDVIMYDFCLKYADGKIIVQNHYSKNTPYLVQSGPLFLKTNEISWLSCSYCVKKEYIEIHQLYFEENVFFEDVDWSIKCVINASSIVFVPESMYQYYQYPIQTTKIKNELKKIGQNFYLSERIRMVAQSVSNEDIKKIILGHYYYHYKCSIVRFWWRLKYQDRIQLLRKYPLYLERDNKDVLLVLASHYPRIFNILISFVKPGLYLAYRMKQLVKRSY